MVPLPLTDTQTEGYILSLKINLNGTKTVEEFSLWTGSTVAKNNAKKASRWQTGEENGQPRSYSSLADFQFLT